jgi:hypothetical protein
MPSVRDSEEAWSVPDVYLLTEGADGRVAIPHLALTFLATGIELARADGELVWHCTWLQLEEMSTSERSILPDGVEGIVVVVVEHGGRRHRFVLPTDQPSVMEAHIRARASSHRIRTLDQPHAASRALTAAVVVASIATVALLMLSAAHLLHF